MQTHTHTRTRTRTHTHTRGRTRGRGRTHTHTHILHTHTRTCCSFPWPVLAVRSYGLCPHVRATRASHPNANQRHVRRRHGPAPQSSIVLYSPPHSPLLLVLHTNRHIIPIYVLTCGTEHIRSGHLQSKTTPRAGVGGAPTCTVSRTSLSAGIDSSDAAYNRNRTPTAAATRHGPHDTHIAELMVTIRPTVAGQNNNVTHQMSSRLKTNKEYSSTKATPFPVKKDQGGTHNASHRHARTCGKLLPSHSHAQQLCKQDRSLLSWHHWWWIMIVMSALWQKKMEAHANRERTLRSTVRGPT